MNPAKWDGMEWMLALLCVAAVCSICNLFASGARLIEVLSRL